jgi:hypothetical protein
MAARRLHGPVDLGQRRRRAGDELLARAVSDTLRVVRLNSRMPRRSSSDRIALLSAVGDMPSASAAARKLRRSATAMAARTSTKPLAHFVLFTGIRHPDYLV